MFNLWFSSCCGEALFYFQLVIVSNFVTCSTVRLSLSLQIFLQKPSAFHFGKFGKCEFQEKNIISLNTLYNVCSVHRGDTMSKYIMMHVGRHHECIGGYHEYIGGYLEYIGGCSVHWGISRCICGSKLIKSFQFLLKSLMY